MTVSPMARVTSFGSAVATEVRSVAAMSGAAEAVAAEGWGEGGGEGGGEGMITAATSACPTIGQYCI